MFKRLRADIRAAKRNDPAARSKFEIWLTYSGVKALSWHRVAHFFYKIHLKLFARMLSQWAKFWTGIEIHPAAKIAGGVFIDHGTGVVIGETAEIEEDVVIYQGVTLGGTGKESGKRHPTIKKGAVISAGAKILGGFTVGEYAKIGAGAVVLKEVPPYTTVVGVPGKIVRVNGAKVVDLEQDKHDPVAEELCKLREKIFLLEERLNKYENLNGTLEQNHATNGVAKDGLASETVEGVAEDGLASDAIDTTDSTATTDANNN